MANSPRYKLGHASAAPGSRDAANAFFTGAIMRNSFLDELRVGLAGSGMSVTHALFENDSASTVLLGLGARLANAKWIAGQWTNATTTYTDDTTDAQDAGTSDFALQTLATNNDGFIVGCLEKFTAVVTAVGTAADDTGGAGGVTGEWNYWNGSSWSALTTLAVSGTSRFFVSGRNEVLFAAPTDWATATSTEITGLPAGSYYAIRYRATDAPDITAALASTLQVWDPLRIVAGQVAANTTFPLVDNASSGILLTGAGEGLVCCITTADADNFVSVCGEYVGTAGVLGGENGATASANP